MSFEILEAEGGDTAYAPLNTTIDADRDYRDLTGLDACACGGGITAQPGGTSLNGYYPDGQLTPGMLGEGDLEAAEGGNKMLWVMGGLLGVWALWAWFTPHEEYR